MKVRRESGEEKWRRGERKKRKSGETSDGKNVLLAYLRVRLNYSVPGSTDISAVHGC